MADPSGRRRILFISNGHGEDSIAAAIIRRLPEGIVAEAYPTIGDGHAYRGVCDIVGPRAKMASQGWRNVRGSVLRDLLSGGLGTIGPGIRFGRAIRQNYDRAVVVGDMVGILGCAVVGARDIVYVDVYKTGHGRLYSAAERWLIGRTAKTVFCRSGRLAAQLAHAGIDARSAGNVMMDTIPRDAYNAALRRRRYAAIALLPGSRQFTTESFVLQTEALSLVTPAKRPDVFLALAASVSLDALADAASMEVRPPSLRDAAALGTLVGQGLTIHVASGGAVGNLLDEADIVLSQAGTATVQALGLGKPVITFINRRDRKSRVRHENALFGEARITVPPDPELVAEALTRLLDDSAERRRLGGIGRKRVGAPGALDEIVKVILASIV